MIQRFICWLGRLFNRAFHFDTYLFDVTEGRWYLYCSKCGNSVFVPKQVIMGLESFDGWPQGKEPKY
jgi:hypothetical protein